MISTEETIADYLILIMVIVKMMKIVMIIIKIRQLLC